MQPAAGDSETDVDDVLRLDELSESSLLCTLRTRFQRRQCFTWAGSILVFLNPWAWVPEAYDAEAEALHRSRRVGAGGSMPARPLPPLQCACAPHPPRLVVPREREPPPAPLPRAVPRLPSAHWLLWHQPHSVHFPPWPQTVWQPSPLALLQLPQTQLLEL